ncbi:coatomer subunit zeta-2 [Hyla sarda]|uniref:coatomer subunit zeta-2 n=1 Tax=Hyla sarda TaxID=327740 RepID=UPI0024C29B72|nr:coatomer subunit zeta-2 [Hyla sarda]
MESLPDPTLYTVRAVIILDQDGNRLVAKYYDCTFPSLVEQREFERKIFHKTHRSESEVVLVDGVTALCQRSADVLCYIIGGPDENELMLLSALTCLCESLCHILRKNVDRNLLLENMDTVFLILDEIIDQGVILECESQKVIQRLNFKTVSEQAFGFVLFDYIAGSSEQREGHRRSALE